MPPTLHPHLKRGLDFAPIHIEPEDAIESLPSGYYEPQEQEAKRRRVEAIAMQYLLRGRPPVILSAGLRGPFDHPWKNPWTTATIRPARSCSEKSSATVVGRSHAGAKNLPKSKGTASIDDRRSRKRNGEHRTEGRVASPETSRATTDGLSFRDQDDSPNQVEVEIPPATAPSPTQDDTSRSTEFFSANTERLIQTRSSLANPFWLRRPESERRGGIHFSQNGNAEASPTRSRSDRSKMAVAEISRAISIKTPLRVQSTSAGTPQAGNWRSSASASMVISSPVNGFDGLRTTEPQPQPCNTAEARPKAEIPAPSIISDHGMQTVAVPGHVPHSAEAGRLAQLSDSHERYMTKSLQAHAKADVPRLPSPMPRPPALTRRTAPENVMGSAPRHDRVASPAPASSTGFMYRKVSDHKCKNGDMPKVKVRAVDFDSSPAKKKVAPVFLYQEEQAGGSRIEKDTVPAQTVPEEHRVDPETSQQDPEQPDWADVTLTELQQAEQDSCLSSHQSLMSTQAAMLLAALEFQESSHRSPSPADTRRWSQMSDNTPRAMLHVPSPAITPLSVFETRLDNAFPKDSVLRGPPPISTQDLFGAASPFAFSTIKKKPTVPPQSGLPFGLAQPRDGDLSADNTTAKIPTRTAERAPLKAKGNTPSLWSFVNEKQSQASQESLVDRSRRSMNDDELPQLDFHTSLGEFETNSGLHFTDRFLHDLDTA